MHSMLADRWDCDINPVQLCKDYVLSEEATWDIQEQQASGPTSRRIARPCLNYLTLTLFWMNRERFTVAFELNLTVLITTRL